MLGRREFAAAGLSAAALATMQATGLAQAPTRRAAGAPVHQEHTEAYETCAKACSDCQRACDMCASHCAHLLHGGDPNHIATLMTCQDCADICACAAHSTARGGPFAATICTACADACSKCAEQCEKFPADKHMAACAKECRKCEAACRQMVQHGVHGSP